MSQAGVKAGLIGGVIAVILVLLGYIPYLGLCLACVGGLVLGFGVGFLAVRIGGKDIATPGEGLGAGALAGAITGFTSSVASTFIELVLNLLGLGVGIYSQFWGGYGVIDREPGILAVLVGGSILCIFNVVFFTILGGLGGLIFKALEGSARPAAAG